MSPNPEWVKKLTVAAPQGSDLLATERAKSNIDVNQLAEYLFGRNELETRDRVLKILTKEPVLDKSQNYFQGREARIEASLAKAKRLRQLQVEHNWTQDEYVIANDLLSEPTPYGLHASMFLKTLRDQGSCRSQVGRFSLSRKTKWSKPTRGNQVRWGL